MMCFCRMFNVNLYSFMQVATLGESSVQSTLRQIFPYLQCHECLPVSPLFAFLYVVALVKSVNLQVTKQNTVLMWAFNYIFNIKVLDSGEPLGLLCKVIKTVCCRLPHHTKRHTVASPVLRNKKQEAKVMCSRPACLLYIPYMYSSILIEVCRAGLWAHKESVFKQKVQCQLMQLSIHAFNPVCHC